VRLFCLERSETREALAKASGRCSLASILRDVNELIITETANVLEITRGAVKTRLRRAHLMLRDILSPGLRQGGQAGLGFKEVSNPWE
jgi:DNA-directed RNA polymerase specialized sigma24 family protein